MHKLQIYSVNLTVRCSIVDAIFKEPFFNIFQRIKDRINELAINDPEDNESDKYHFKESIL